MSLMSKLLTTTLLLSSLLNASTTSKQVEKYLDNEFGDNPRISKLDIKVIQETPLKELKGWSTYIVDINAVLKDKPGETIKQKMIWFSNGIVITKELANIKTSESYTDMVKPDFQRSYYSEANLISGNKNSKHRVAIFSDPLCPFCKDFAPKAINYMKKQPEKFAVYYYHYPILRIHPASAIVIRAAVVAENKGVKDVSAKMYNIKIDPREKDVAKILTAFNKVVGSNVTQIELQTKKVSAHIAHDQEIAKNVFVNGTPTIYVDDKIDKTRKLYKTIK